MRLNSKFVSFVGLLRISAGKEVTSGITDCMLVQGVSRLAKSKVVRISDR
jgi:hypothetical protein